MFFAYKKYPTKIVFFLFRFFLFWFVFYSLSWIKFIIFFLFYMKWIQLLLFLPSSLVETIHDLFSQIFFSALCVCFFTSHSVYLCSLFTYYFLVVFLFIPIRFFFSPICANMFFISFTKSQCLHLLRTLATLFLLSLCVYCSLVVFYDFIKFNTWFC